MRLRTAVIIALLLSLAVAGGVLVARERQAEAMRSQGIIIGKVAVGETYTIVLESNPTTGYSWHAVYDEAGLELVEQEYEPGESGLIGAGGTERLIFKALAKGVYEIRLLYQRPWEGIPDQTVVHKLTVR